MKLPHGERSVNATQRVLVKATHIIKFIQSPQPTQTLTIPLRNFYLQILRSIFPIVILLSTIFPVQSSQLHKKTVQPMTQPFPLLKFSSPQEVQQYAQQTQKCLLILQDNILDATSFAPHHPGGAFLLKNNNLKNIQEQMKFHHPLTINMANTMAIGSFKKDIERLIDPNNALLTQIWKLNHEQYLHVVQSPYWLFTDSPKMFETDWLDGFSHATWKVVPLMPIIVISYMFWQLENWDTFSIQQAILAAVSGLVFFTLVEYCLHRFIFHCDRYIPDSRVAHYLHFFAHGIHHMLPNDPYRLVLPPPLYCIIFTLGYFTVGQVVKFNDHVFSVFFWTAFQIGYVIYDLCHYALHHVDTSKSKGSYFHRLQKYHNQHHFGGEQAGFGVSSPLWDIIFRTGYTKIKET